MASLPDDPGKYSPSSCNLLFPNPLVAGQSLYLGGSYCPITDKIYCIPGHATQVLIIDPKTDTCTPMNHPPLEGQFKYLRSIYIPQSKCIYGLPCNSDHVLKIYPESQTVTTLPIPFETEEEKLTKWKYHGGAVLPKDGCIYAIPQSAQKVLKIDPQTDEISLIGPTLPGRYKWYGGVVGKTDGAIYGIPHNSSHVLRIDHSHQIDLIGDFGNGGHKWHGAEISSESNGTIVCIPANSNTVLLITPAPQPITEDNVHQIEKCTFREIGGPDVIQTGRHRTDSKYKYLGAVSSPTDKKVYCLPSGSEYVLQVDVSNLKVSNVGPNIRDGVDSNPSPDSDVNGGNDNVPFCQERMRQNKWQNGFYSHRDKCCYGIPLNGETVLKIQTYENEDPIVSTIPLPDPKGGLSKWEGGTVAASNGDMYCMPNNHKAVLKISPAKYLHLPTKHKIDEKIVMTEMKGEDEVENYLNSSSNSMSRKNADSTLPPSQRPNHNQHEHHDPSTRNDEQHFLSESKSEVVPTTQPEFESIYKTGIPTLRSSAHRVKHNRRRRNKSTKNPKQKQPPKAPTKTELPKLPPSLKEERIITYDKNMYNLQLPILEMLQKVQPHIVGSFSSSGALKKLEDFHVPPNTLSRKNYGGICEDAQKYLSDFVSQDESFLSHFDRFVIKGILPGLKNRLRERMNKTQMIDKDESSDSLECKEDFKSEEMQMEHDQIAFYYQRPPTLRLQPGPSRASVKTHRDSDYGHQEGELNYWGTLHHTHGFYSF